MIGLIDRCEENWIYPRQEHVQEKRRIFFTEDCPVRDEG